MAGGRELKVIISGDPSSLNKAFKSASNTSKGFGSSLKKMGVIAGAAAIGGIAAVAVGLKKSVDAAAEAEVSQRKLETQLKALDISYAKHGQTIDDTLKKQSMLSAFDDEDLADSFTNLVRLTGDVNKALELNALAADIARQKGKDLSTGTAIVTKAQMGNIGALKRQGIEIEKVTTAQDALKKGASDSAKEQAKAQDLIATKQQAVALLQEKFAGQAKAYGETAAGAQERLGVAFENLGEVIGAKVLPHLVPVVNQITNFINKAAESEKLGRILTTVGTVITAAITAIKTAFSELAAAAERNWPRIQAAALKVMNWYKNNLEPTITSVSKNIAAAWKKSGDDSEKSTRDTFGKIPPFMLAIGQANLRIINASLAILRGDWSKAWKELSGIPEVLLRGMLNQLKFLGNGLKAILVAAANAGFQAFVAAMQSWFGKISALMSSLPGRIRGALGNLGGILYAAGVAVLQGFYNGLVAKFEAIKNFIGGIAGWIQANKGPAEKDKTLLNQAGQLIIQGLQDGMQVQWVKLQSYVDGLSGDIATRYGKVVDAAIAAVTAKQGALQAAFDALSSVALEAFDKLTSDFETKTEKKIREQDARMAKAAREAALRAAREDISAASTPLVRKEDETDEDFAGRERERLQALTAARQAESEALFAIQRAADEKRAEQERKVYEDRRALQRKRFEEGLTDLRGDLLRGEITRREYNQRLIALYKDFGIPLRQRGKALGLALAEGLSDAQVNVKNAARGLMDAIQSQLQNMEFVVNVLVRDAGRDGKDGKRATGGPVRRGGSYLVGERGPELFVPNQSGRVIANNATGGGGGLTVVVNVGGSVVSERNLVEAVRQGLVRSGFRNGGGMLGGQA